MLHSTIHAKKSLLPKYTLLKWTPQKGCASSARDSGSEYDFGEQFEFHGVRYIYIRANITGKGINPSSHPIGLYSSVD